MYALNLPKLFTVIKKAGALLILALVSILIFTYFYVYKDHRDISNTKTFKSYEADQLTSIFTDDDISNDKDVLDQVIEVSGIITDQSGNNFVINNNIFVVLLKNQQVPKNKKVTIKGRCLGYDDLLEEVKIDQASFITN